MDAYDRARLEVLAGLPVTVDVHTPARLRRAVALAADTGAPLGAAVEAAAAAAAAHDEARRAVQVAAAQPRLVAALLLALPFGLFVVVTAATGASAGLLLEHPLGRVALVVGLALQGAGVMAVVVLVRRARPGTESRGRPTADEVVDLVSAAVQAGRPAGAALRDVAAVVDGHAPALRRGALALERGAAVLPANAIVAEIVDLLRVAGRLGASPVQPLRDLAERQRRSDRARALAAAQRLPVLLAIPTALFLLPAAVVLAGAPLLLHLTTVGP